MMKKLIFLTYIFFTPFIYAQQIGIGAKGGLLIGTQSGKRALVSYHTDLFFESLGKWQGEGVQRRIGYLIQLGYHRKGASYNTGIFNSSGNSIPSDIFHNFSLAVLLKGSFQLNNNFLPYYGAGVRLDITPGSDFAQVINPRDQQGVTFANFGFWLGGGIEWESPKLPFGCFVEVSINPDITPQIFFPKGTLVQYPDFYNPGTTRTEQFSEDYRIINTCFEVTFGIKFIKRKTNQAD